jgi:hypothetical protein
MLELPADESSLAPEVQRILADRLHARVSRPRPASRPTALEATPIMVLLVGAGGRTRGPATPALLPTSLSLAPGEEYLVLQPGGAADRFTVLLEPGTYSVEWFSIEGRQTIPGEETTVDRSMATSFNPPSEAFGPAVLYLRRVD